MDGMKYFRVQTKQVYNWACFLIPVYNLITGGSDHGQLSLFAQARVCLEESTAVSPKMVADCSCGRRRSLRKRFSADGASAERGKADSQQCKVSGTVQELGFVHGRGVFGRMSPSEGLC